MHSDARRRTEWIVPLGFLLLVTIGGLLYAYLLSIPGVMAIPLAVALGLEAAAYTAVVHEPTRKRLAGIASKRVLALGMTVSALVPYVVFALGTQAFSWVALGQLALAALVSSLWYTALPRRGAIDVLFLMFFAAIALSPLFASTYPSPVPRIPASILGHLMWTRLAIFECLAIGEMSVAGFGLWPSRREWLTGTLHFLMFVPFGMALGWATGFATFHVRPGPWWQTAGVAVATFLGMLWVVALREEFFFRGLLQEWLVGGLRNEWIALAITSLLFGAVHLLFRSFPNWRFALLATIAGFFYGRAYLSARSVRAAMVTHALVNTAWRLLFS